MNNCADKKTEYKKSAVILLSVFLFVRAFLISPDTKTGIFINPIAITTTEVNAIYILLLAVFSVLFSVVLLKIYKNHDALTAVPVVLIVADPVFPYMLQSCINLILGILLLLNLISFKEKTYGTKTISFAVFSAIAALLSPMSLFMFIPIALLLFVFGDGRKSFLPIIVSAFTFAVFSVIHGGLYESNSSFKNFIYSFSFSENREFIRTAESPDAIAPACAFTFIFFALVVYIFVKQFTASANIKNNKVESFNDMISNAVTAALAFAAAVIGAAVYGTVISAFILTVIIFIRLIKMQDRITCEIAEKTRSFTDNNFFLLILLLAAMSVVMLSLRSPSGVYTSAATYFT